ncbi:MAG: hypothetical protein V4635_15750 [Bacteroidota bacterium]
MNLITFVCMLFSVTEFEQSFSDKNLKKALRLMREQRILLQQRLPNNSFHFLIDNQFDLFVKKRGEKILSYTCFCYEQPFCAHLAAALFYLQKDILSLTSVDKTKKLNAGAHKKADNFKRLRVNTSSAEDGGKSEKGTFLFCVDRVYNMLGPYLQLDRLSQKQINTIHLKMVELLDSAAVLSHPGEHSAGHRNRPGLFNLQLALACCLPLIFNLRMLGEESLLLGLFENNFKKLDHSYRAGLLKIEQQNWFASVLLAAKIKNRVGAEAFDFLLPRALCFIKKETDFDRLETLAAKRKTESNIPGQFDKAAIAKMQVAIARKKSGSPVRHFTDTPEFVIARAELLFCSSKTDKAFKMLGDFFEKVKKEFPRQLHAYLDYLMLRAKEYHQSNIELKYLKESMVFGLYINPAHLNRFFELQPMKTCGPEIDKMVSRIIQLSGDHSLDKLPALLLRDGRPDALLPFIKRHRNKFKLLHAIALQKFPSFDDEFLSLYMKHLFEALTGALNERYHEQVFITAKEYLSRLPGQITDELVLKLLLRLGPFSPVAKYIAQHYPVNEAAEILPLKKREMKHR